MARSKRRRRVGGGNANGKGDNKQGKSQRSTTETAAEGRDYVTMIVDQGNYKMEAYYAAQGLHNWRWNATTDELVPCTAANEKDEERMRWRSTMIQVLPASFRIAKDVPDSLREQIEGELKEMLENYQKDAEEQGTVIKELKFLPHAYQLAVDRSTIRKNPHLNKLHEWLKQQTLAGFITRQETVSMVPPVLLAPNPNDRVLDMCAAPGSKTSQLLESLGPQGCIVANDSNIQRAHMLVTQLRRIMHMNPQVLITCCDGQQFPAVVQFDRILCDVPCSGDGTSRKNINIWKNWSQTGALALHALQLTIAWKGAAELLKVGGYMCYSTCSMNPVEDEAVVAELIRRSNGSLELVAVQLEGFKTRPGWSQWKVFCEKNFQANKKSSHHKSKPTSDPSPLSPEKPLETEIADNDLNGTTALNDAVDNSDEAVNEKSEAGEIDPDVSPADDAPPRAYNAEAAFNARPRFHPQSMDEAALIEMAVSDGLQLFHTMDEVPEEFQRRIRQSCFPPTEEEVKTMHLERCVRCLPHDNDTGGFFVAVLHKVGEISNTDKRMANKKVEEPETKRAKVEEETMEVEADVGEPDSRNDADDANISGVEDDNDKQTRGYLSKGDFRRSRGGKSRVVCRDDFVPVDDAVLGPIFEHFGFTAPEFEKDLLMSRANGDSKNIYFIPRPIKNLMDNGIQERLIIINSGLKAFSQGSTEGSIVHRVCQEAAHFLVPYMTKRKFVVSMDDFMKCFGEEKYVAMEEFSEGLREKLRELSLGSFVLVLEGYEDQLHHKLVATMWRCRADRIDKLVAKVEIDAIKTKLAALQAKSQIQAQQ